jgi:hypothetical protein
MSMMRPGYKDLDLKIFSIEEKSSHTPKRPSMVGENKYDGTIDPFKIFLDESLMQQRNKMMDNFAQILQRLPTSDASYKRGSVAPFKVQINIGIPIF